MNLRNLAAALLALLALPAAAQTQEYGVVLRTTNPSGGYQDRIRIESGTSLSRVQFVSAYLDMGGEAARNLAWPVDPADAATKAYVDSVVAGVLGSGITAGVLGGFSQIADGAGAVQFTADAQDTLAFAAAGGLAVSFNASTQEVAFSIPDGSITSAHLAGSIDPSKISGTALTASTSFDETSGSDATVSGSYNSLNLQLVAGSITDSDITGPISASKIEDLWVNTSGDSMSGLLVADAGVAIPTGQQLRLLSASNSNWSLRTTSAAGELSLDITGESLAGEARQWRLRDLAGAGATRFSVDMLTGAMGVTGTLSMGSNKITNLVDPTAATDAATKAYVDATVGAGMGITSINGQTGPALHLTASAGSGLSVAAASGTLAVHSDLLNATTTNDYVHWNVLAGIPAGFADGIDDQALYSAGTGLSLAGSTLSVNFGTTAETVAAGNHGHDPTYVNASGDTMTGSFGIGQTPAAGEQLVVVGPQASIVVR